MVAIDPVHRAGRSTFFLMFSWKKGARPCGASPPKTEESSCARLLGGVVPVLWGCWAGGWIRSSRRLLLLLIDLEGFSFFFVHCCEAFRIELRALGGDVSKCFRSSKGR